MEPVVKGQEENGMCKIWQGRVRSTDIFYGGGTHTEAFVLSLTQKRY